MPAQQVTRTLAAWASACQLTDIPGSVRHEGLRTFTNWAGCAVGGSREDTVRRALAGVRPFAGSAQAHVLGFDERLDAPHAALVNGIASHVLDYDDTHLKTIIHPGGPAASAALALGELAGASGSQVLAAIIVGVEATCRIGNAVYPDHYDRGWHITGTAGVFGAAIAAGRILELDETGMAWALGLAASQASGLREMFGTMTKSFHPGAAARSGILAASLAKAGFTSSERALEAPRGFAQVLSTKQDYEEIVDGLGSRWEAALNTYKPFACGIVIHPAIDGCLQIRQKIGDRVESIARVHLRTNPLVLELTGKPEPATGLEGKFSVFHAVASALLHGDGSPTAFTDERVRDPGIVALRDRVTVDADPAVHEASVDISVTFGDGDRVDLSVEHAIGSLERPLSDDDLNTKFRGQVVPVLGEAACEELLEAAWHLDELERAADLSRAAVPRA